MRVRLIFLFVAVFALPRHAWAQSDEPLAAQFTKGKRIKKRGKLSALRGHRVSIAGRKTMTAGEIGDKVFREQREVAREFRAARGALLGEPEVSEELVETDEAVVITTRTKVVVVDPEAMRKTSRRFAKMREKRGREGFKLSSLDKGQRQQFAAYRARMQKLPAKHPLHAAAMKGDEALLDALVAGKGDLTVSSTVIIPKAPMKRTAKGELMVRTVGADGRVDFTRTRNVAGPVGRATLRSSTAEGAEVDVPPATSTTSSGQTTSKAKFLTGFTEADDFIWELRWDFSFGHVSVKFHPWYEFGLRVPVEFTGTLSPKKITNTGPRDVNEPFTVDLSARAFNAGESYYQETGLARELIEKGNEFLLGAGFEIIIRVKAGFVVNKKWVLPKNAAFSLNRNIEPPFGNCGSKCGVDIWIDPTITRTKISLLGIVTGSASLGFKIGGKGTASAQFEALYGKETVGSWPKGQKSQKKRKHRVSFDKPDVIQTFKAETQKHDRAGTTKNFGYKLSDPQYDWDLEVTPGIRGDIRVKAKPLLNDTFTIGPEWFDAFAIDLGHVKLERHKGTKKAYKVKHGTKTWQN